MSHIHLFKFLLKNNYRQRKFSLSVQQEQREPTNWQVFHVHIRITLQI